MGRHVLDYYWRFDLAYNYSSEVSSHQLHPIHPPPLPPTHTHLQKRRVIWVRLFCYFYFMFVEMSKLRYGILNSNRAVLKHLCLGSWRYPPAWAKNIFVLIIRLCDIRSKHKEIPMAPMYLGTKASKNIHSAKKNKRKTIKTNDWQARSESWGAVVTGSFWLLFDTWRVVMSCLLRQENGMRRK